MFDSDLFCSQSKDSQIVQRKYGKQFIENVYCHGIKTENGLVFGSSIVAYVLVDKITLP